MKLIVFLPGFLFASLALAASPAPQSTTLVLVVASNRGPTLDRPPLQYADDDDAKYHEVFASLAGEANTTLLTELNLEKENVYVMVEICP